jgi:hypothetical protein
MVRRCAACWTFWKADDLRAAWGAGVFGLWDDGLAMVVQQVLAEDPFGAAVYDFRGRRGSLI